MSRKTLLLIIPLIVAATAAEAQTLNNIANSYQNAAAGWNAVIFPVAQRLFGALALIELTWAALLWTLNRDDPSNIIVGLLRKVLGLGFFFALLLNAPTWLPAIVNSFAGIGAQAGGVSVLDPSAVLTQGLTVAAQALETVGGWGILSSPAGAIIGGLCALLVVFAFAVIAGQLLVTLIESYIVIGAGTLLLAFSGSRWTASFAERFLAYAVAVGVKLFVLYLIIGIGSTIAPSWAPLLSSAGITNLQPFLEVSAGALVFMFVAWSIPQFASSMMVGSPSLTLGDAARVAISTGRGVAMAAAPGTPAVGAAMRAGGRALKSVLPGGGGGGGSGGGVSLRKAAGAGQGRNWTPPNAVYKPSRPMATRKA